MKKDNIKLAVSLLLSCAIPMISQAVFKNSPYISSPGMFFVFWGLINFLFISTLIDLSENYGQMFKLKNLKTNKGTFIVNIIVYLCFLIFINLYFEQQLYIRDNLILNTLSNINVLFLILIMFIINLYCGQFPEAEETDNTRLFTLNKKSRFKYGHEKLGHVVGEYEDGITIGFLPFSFDNIKSVYTDTKNDALVIKGKDGNGNFRINIAAPKSRLAAEDILHRAVENKKLKNGKFNI